MGLFDKKFCDVCGAKIGLLGNRKLEDGNLCKECAGKLSPWFSERRHSTVQSIKEQLAYRENNRAAANAFQTTRIFGEGSQQLFIDENARKFAVCYKKNMPSGNPDIIDLSAILSTMPDSREYKRELRMKDSTGKEVSYNPPRYEYSYDFYFKITVNHPYIDEISFQLNNSRVVLREATGGEKVSGLLGVLAGQTNTINLMNPEYQKYINLQIEIGRALMGTLADHIASAGASSDSLSFMDAMNAASNTVPSTGAAGVSASVAGVAGAVTAAAGMVGGVGVAPAVTGKPVAPVATVDVAPAVTPVATPVSAPAASGYSEDGFVNAPGMVTFTEADVSDPTEMAAPVQAGRWFCPNCGSENYGRFCGSCGTPKP